jgi:hypothetical protein
MHHTFWITIKSITIIIILTPISLRSILTLRDYCVVVVLFLMKLVRLEIQDRQRSYNVTWGAFTKPLLLSKSNKFNILVCERVCAIVRVCGYPGTYACACAYVHTASLIQHATPKRRTVTSFVAPSSPPYFQYIIL